MFRAEFFLIPTVVLTFAGAPLAQAGNGGFVDQDEMGASSDEVPTNDGDEEVNGFELVAPSNLGQSGPTLVPLQINGPSSNDGEDDGTPAQDSNESDGDEAID